MKPSYIFNSRNELLEKLKYWQHILALDSWIIEVEQVDSIPNEVNELITTGNNCVDHANCTAQIKIASVDDSLIAGRRFDELTLVHELVHCVVPTYDSESPDIPNMLFECMGERQIETLAKSLIKVKYNLDTADFYKKGGYMR